MKLYIVRNGKAERRSEWDGPEPLRPLAPRGLRQSKALAGVLAGERVTRILSSPHLRCVQTVEPLCAATGMTIEFDERLAEGASPDKAFELLQEIGDEPAVLCSHGDVIRGILAELEYHGARIDLEGKLRCEKGSVWIAEDADGKRRATYHASLPSSDTSKRETEREIIAVLDLGSTSFRLVLFEATRAGRLDRVLNERVLLRLGAAIGPDGRIPDADCETAIAAAHHLGDIAREAGASRVLPVATAALRDAANGPELCAVIGEAIGRKVRLISGEDEARLLFVALQRRIALPQRPTFGLDLGGGSLELVIGDARDIHWATSLPIGVTRLQREFAGRDPLRKRDVRLMRERLFDALEPHRAAISDLAPALSVAAGGSARSLANIANLHRRLQGKTAQSPGRISSRRLQQLTKRLVRATHDERLAIPGVREARVDLLPIGGILLSALAEALGIESYLVSDWGLREGVVLDALETFDEA